MQPAQLAAVSVKNHRHGTANPRAGASTRSHHRRSTRVADDRGSTDAAAVLLARATAAAAVVAQRVRLAMYVCVRLFCARGDSGGSPLTVCVGLGVVHKTAVQAFEAARLGPQEIDLFEVRDDAFTIGEIVTVEALGLAQVGLGAKLTEAGHTTIGGRHPVNPSGGLLSRGHPLGATGPHSLLKRCGNSAVRQVHARSKEHVSSSSRQWVVERRESMATGASSLSLNPGAD